MIRWREAGPEGAHPWCSGSLRLRETRRGLESGRLYDLNSEGPRLQGSRTFLRVLCGGHRGDWGYKCEWRQGVGLGGSRMLYVYYWSPGRDRAACVLEMVAGYVLDCRHTVGTLCAVMLVAVAPQWIVH